MTTLFKSKDDRKTVILTGGGTAGHVVPHLAMLGYYEAHNIMVHYVGSANGIEKDLLAPFKHVTYKVISVGKLRRYLSFENLKDFFRVFFGFLQCLIYLHRVKPRFVFSKGGFVSVPVCWAAFFLRIPVFTHESDFSPGLATKLIVPFAKQIFCAFESTANQFRKRGKPAEWVGIPIRDELYLGSPEKALKLCKWNSNTSSKPVLLVVGGSLGAKAINDSIEQNFNDLIKAFRVIHITGKSKQMNLQNSDQYIQFEFLKDEFKDVLALADVVVSRSGATAIFEFLALKKLMLLIPLEKGSRGDQIENAEFFLKKRWAAVLQESELQSESKKLLDRLINLQSEKLIYLKAFEEAWDAKFVGRHIFEKMMLSSEEKF